jgi:hypothetical protein
MAWPTSWYATSDLALPSTRGLPSIPATMRSMESSISWLRMPCRGCQGCASVCQTSRACAVPGCALACFLACNDTATFPEQLAHLHLAAPMLKCCVAGYISPLYACAELACSSDSWADDI